MDTEVKTYAPADEVVRDTVKKLGLQLFDNATKVVKSIKPELEFLIKAGFDINQGMAIYLDGQLYFGADCINRIALLSASSDVFNKVNHFIFRSQR